MKWERLSFNVIQNSYIIKFSNRRQILWKRRRTSYVHVTSDKETTAKCIYLKVINKYIARFSPFIGWILFKSFKIAAVSKSLLMVFRLWFIVVSPSERIPKIDKYAILINFKYGLQLSNGFLKDILVSRKLLNTYSMIPNVL